MKFEEIYGNQRKVEEYFGKVYRCPRKEMIHSDTSLHGHYLAMYPYVHLRGLFEKSASQNNPHFTQNIAKKC